MKVNESVTFLHVAIQYLYVIHALIKYIDTWKIRMLLKREQMAGKL